MKHLRIPALLRVMIVALAVLLAGCDDDPALPPSLNGTWLAAAPTPDATRIEDRLELTPDGRYVWTTVMFSPEGRSQDGMLGWLSRSGDWGVEGDRLVLRTLSGMSWQHGGGWSQLDYIPTWLASHRLRLQNDRLMLTELPEPERSAAPRTYTFQRVTGALDTTQP
jgi:hypothetical protein